MNVMKAAWPKVKSLGRKKQLFNEVVRMEITEYSTKLTGKYLLNAAVRGHSKALKFGECLFIILNQRFTVSFGENTAK